MREKQERPLKSSPTPESAVYAKTASQVNLVRSVHPGTSKRSKRGEMTRRRKEKEVWAGTTAITKPG